MAAKKKNNSVSSTNNFVKVTPYSASTKGKPNPNDKPGPWDNIARGTKTAGKIAYEVSGAGDVKRFVQNPSLKTAGSLALTVGAYAAGPIIKGAVAAKAVKASSAVMKTQEVRAAAAALAAKDATRTVRAYKGAGVVETAAKSKLGMTGIKTFTTGKNPNAVAAGVRKAVEKEAVGAAKKVVAQNAKKVAAAKTAATAVASAKAGSTASTYKQPGKKKK